MTYAPGTDVIVISYRTPGDLGEFLDSYVMGPDESLMVVNVDPLDADREFVKSYGEQNYSEHANVSYIEHDTNVGYGIAVNDAAKRGNREVIAIFNADVVLHPDRDAVQRCSRLLLSDPSYAVVGPLQTDGHGKATHPGIFGTHKEPKWRGWMSAVSDELRDVRDDAVTVMGSAFFVKRSVWDELTNCPIYHDQCGADGAFLPTQLYFEETWAAYHAASHSYKIVYDGSTEIVHKWHGSVKANDVEAWAAEQFRYSQKTFRDMCDAHSIEHD